MHQRYSIIAALQTSCRYDFGFPTYFSTNLLSRTYFVFGVSMVVLLRAHKATISIPCLVVSGGVRRPTGVFSSMSRSDSGRSAEVLVTISLIAAFCMDLK